MQFEFDENKSKINRKKHGIDFIEAQKLWEDPERIEIEARLTDEPGYLLLAVLNDVCWSAIFTIRGENIRIISVRKSRDNEKEIYFSI
ncbi:MAG: BrnT family toxin [Bacteroidales bacterium]